jgi:hypothetical protein
MEPLVIPLVLAMMMAVKQIPLFASTESGGRANAWLLPWISAGLGVGGVFLYTAAFGSDLNVGQCILNGILYGLAAAGLWDGGFNQAAKAIAKPAVVLVLAAVLTISAGCQAPATVREAQVYEGQCLATYVANVQLERQTWATIYEQARQADVDYATAKAIEVVKAKAKTPEDIEAGIRAVVAERERAALATTAVKTKMAKIGQANDGEVAKALRIHGGLAEWLEAGVNETAIPGMATELLDAINAFKAGHATVITTTPTAAAAP